MKLRIVLGIALILVAIVTMLILVVLPVLPGQSDNPAVLNFMASILCQSGERTEIEVVVTHDSDGTGYTPYTTCIGRENERTDASGKHLLITLVAFTVPFLVGLLLLIVNFGRAKRDVQDVLQTGQELIQIGREGFSLASVASVNVGGTGGFADKLKELEEAHSAGLITSDEYDRLRKEILDKMV
jgi:hypothetical protein